MINGLMVKQRVKQRVKQKAERRMEQFLARKLLPPAKQQ
jgi:hypothetical protein